MIFKRKEKRPYGKDAAKQLDKMVTDAANAIVVESMHMKELQVKQQTALIRSLLRNYFEDAAELGYEDAPTDTRSEMEKRFGTFSSPFSSYTITTRKEDESGSSKARSK